MGRPSLWLVVLVGCAGVDPDHSIERSELATEIEPNNLRATAMPIIGDRVAIRGNSFAAGDVDYYSFDGVAGDEVFAATQTQFSAGTGDSTLTLYDPSGNVIEVDYDNGAFNQLSSVIAGRDLTVTGTHYLAVSGGDVRPYDLFFQRRRGTPAAEPEPNWVSDNQPLPASGWMSGLIVNLIDEDFFTFSVNAGETIWISVDVDPDRFGLQSTARIGLSYNGNTVAVADDPNDNSMPGNAESLAITVWSTGEYTVHLFGTSGDYSLNVTTFPPEDKTGCTTVFGGGGNIPNGNGTLEVPVDVTEDMMLGDVDASVSINHVNLAELDVRLVSPEGTSVGLFTNQATTGVFNDDSVLTNTPERAYRLSWFDDEPSLGTWKLVVNDDATGSYAGSLNGFSITMCPRPPDPTCPVGTKLKARFATSFDTDDGGFTHTGIADSWAYGTPLSPPITACKSAPSCWKTNLTGPYLDGSTQDLTSPVISLAGLQAPIWVEWWQKHQLEDASADQAYVDAVPVPTGSAPSVRLFEHLDPTMFDIVGGPTISTQVDTIAGWAHRRARIDQLQNLDMRLLFHLQANGASAFQGLVIDDVKVLGCAPNCGDGAPDAGEVCDDGNAVNGDSCDNNCTVPACGNGIRAGTEACDDGNAVNGDSCDSNCTVPACGNGITAGTEACDDGNAVNGDSCDNNCTVPACGNGIPTGTEACDDGNSVNGDSCDTNCTVPACGNGIPAGTEACDDGNAVNGDSCDNNCTVPACGNGITAGTEACDDGNAVNGDSCDNNCTVPACGNGIPAGTEACDDGNAVNGDSCDTNCTIPACGNGIRAGTEACDDGNAVNGDSCDTNCTVPACGNGIRAGTEVCDDGNAVDGDTCDSDCTLSVCGNGIQAAAEACDDGNTVGGDGCTADCRIEDASGCGCATRDPEPSWFLLALGLIGVLRRRTRPRVSA